MIRVNARFWSLALATMLLVGCFPSIGGGGSDRGLEIKFLAGSALDDFCTRAAEQFNRQQPQLDDGQPFYLSCEALGSGDVVSTLTNLAEQLQQGTLQADSPEFPTLVSVDGGIYHAQLIYEMEQIFPGQNYIPSLTDAPLLAFSPMVLMAEAEIARGLRKVDNPFAAIARAENHKQIDPSSPDFPVSFVHTAPTRSNSGLQTLVVQFAAVSGKRPENLTIADIQQYRDQVREIQSKITRYGVSTSSLAKDMVNNGPYWASVGSVYESLVIRANTENTRNTRYEAVYPAATFTSNMRAILPDAPWVSDTERAAAEQVIEYLRSPQAQQIAVDLGLRPGVPGIELGDKFSDRFGVDPNPQYDSYRPPQADVVAAAIESWQQYAKKPSQVAIIVDTSGSMEGRKIASVQSTLQTYIESLGPKEEIALISFSSEIQTPILVDGSEQGRARGLQYVANLNAEGGTRLYDASLFARNWLQEKYRNDAINAVLILTDGQDSGSNISLQQLEQQLQASGYTSDREIAFFTIGYGREGDFDPAVLQQIAEVNGGYYRKGDPETIPRVLSDLQLEF